MGQRAALLCNRHTQGEVRQCTPVSSSSSGMSEVLLCERDFSTAFDSRATRVCMGWGGKQISSSIDFRACWSLPSADR